MPWWCVESWEISLWNLNLCYVLNILGESVSYWIVSQLEGTCRIINLSDRGENCKSQEYKMSHGIHQSSKFHSSFSFLHTLYSDPHLKIIHLSIHICLCLLFKSITTWVWCHYLISFGIISKWFHDEHWCTRSCYKLLFLRLCLTVKVFSFFPRLSLLTLREQESGPITDWYYLIFVNRRGHW